MLALVQNTLRRGFGRVEKVYAQFFSPMWNPFIHLGGLSFFFFWVATFSGLYLYIFFETSIDGAYASIETLTVEQWFLGGIVRSFHRYSSAAMMLTMTLHMLREFAMGRYTGKRVFSWVSGIPLIWLLFASGISGYWLVWDVQAQYIAQMTAALFDWLPIMVDPMARNFLNEASLSDRFFSLMSFLHIGIPLVLLLGMFIHISRINNARSNPPRKMQWANLSLLLLMSLLTPAVSQPPANLNRSVTTLGLDWFYLNVYPLISLWGPGAVWALLIGISLLLTALPWLWTWLHPPRQKRRAKQNDSAESSL